MPETLHQHLPLRRYARVGAAIVALLILGFFLFYSRPASSPFGSWQRAANTQALPENVAVQTLTVGSGVAALMGDTVSIDYIAALPNGRIFDRTDSERPFTFTLGTRDVMIGLNLGVAGMKIGEERRVTVPAVLAYGEQGSTEKGVPPSTTLTFDVRLLKIVSPHLQKNP